jgi:hypothetical protein
MTALVSDENEPDPGGLAEVVEQVAVVGVGGGTSNENAVGLTLPSLVAAYDWLVVVSACEKTTAAENQSTTRPRIFVNWGLDEWIDE